MLRKANKLKGFAITAIDGAIGDIDDFYFDDETWTARYLVVNTGTWLSDRKVLISPISIKSVSEPVKQVFVTLTMDQVKNSPDIDSHKPVSRQHETAFMDYYGYPYYWGGPYLWGAAAYPAALTMPPATASQIAAAATARQRETEQQDKHLRSVAEVTGYHVEAVDGDAGYVHDFIIDDVSWAIRYLEIESASWWSGAKAVISPEWIESISWTESKLFLNLTRDEIRNSPEYDEEALLSRDYETNLHRHYGREGYWD